jgi:ketosteroid isomerase-like protein
MTPLDHARAEDLLDRYAAARSSWDGDAFVGLHTADVEAFNDPFEPPLRGSNEIRKALLEASEAEEQVEFTFERHWVVPPTILAAWHASYVHRQTRARIRTAGFVAFEIAEDGRIRRARFWYNRREFPRE